MYDFKEEEMKKVIFLLLLCLGMTSGLFAHRFINNIRDLSDGPCKIKVWVRFERGIGIGKAKTAQSPELSYHKGWTVRPGAFDGHINKIIVYLKRTGQTEFDKIIEISRTFPGNLTYYISKNVQSNGKIKINIKQSGNLDVLRTSSRELDA